MDSHRLELLIYLVNVCPAGQDARTVEAEGHLLPGVLGQLLKGEVATVLVVVPQVGRLKPVVVFAHWLLPQKCAPPKDCLSSILSALPGESQPAHAARRFTGGSRFKVLRTA